MSRPPPKEPEPIDDDQARGDFHEIFLLSEINPTDRKAEAWLQHGEFDGLYKDRCLECREVMWTWSVKEDICERCGHILRDKRSDLIVKKERAREMPNAFRDEQRGHVPVNVDTGREVRPVNPYAAPVERPVRSNPMAAQPTHRKTHSPF